MAQRCVLLPCPVGLGGLELELLPPTACLDDMMEEEQGQHFHSALAGGAQLHWRHHATSAWQPNPLASHLAATHVCGDAILVLPARSEAEMQQQVQQLACKHLRGTEWRLSGAWAGTAGSSSAGSQHRLQRRQRQQDALRGLLLRSAGAGVTAPQAARGEAAVAEAPATPPHRHATAHGDRAQHEERANECEPRQQLLWSIASRATSIRWQAPAAAVAAAAAAVAATAAVASEAVVPVAVAPVAEAEAATEAAGMAAPAASAAAAEAGQPAKHRSSLEHSRAPWADLQPELLAVVLAQAGHGPTFARTLTQVCSGWRRGIGGERSTLQRLRFTCLELVASSSGDGSSSRSSGGVPAASTTAPSSQAQRQRAGLPWLVRQSVAAGNVAATVAAARWLDRGQAERRPTCPHNAAAAALAAGAWYGGCEAAAGAVAAASSADAAAGISEAARLWRAASKLGHPEAQWRLGWAHYKGFMGLAHDGEEAHLWLSRAAKQLAETLAVSLDGSAAGSSGGRAAGGQQVTLPALMTEAGCRRILAQAAHILGYLSLDGEGTRVDVGTALRWFRLAERHGCMEAGRMIGSLLNTGMYG